MIVLTPMQLAWLESIVKDGPTAWCMDGPASVKVTVMTPSLGVNLMALPTRFVTTPTFDPFTVQVNILVRE